MKSVLIFMLITCISGIALADQKSKKSGYGIDDYVLSRQNSDGDKNVQPLPKSTGFDTIGNLDRVTRDKVGKNDSLDSVGVALFKTEYCRQLEKSVSDVCHSTRDPDILKVRLNQKIHQCEQAGVTNKLCQQAKQLSISLDAFEKGYVTANKNCRDIISGALSEIDSASSN